MAVRGKDGKFVKGSVEQTVETIKPEEMKMTDAVSTTATKRIQRAATFGEIESNIPIPEGDARSARGVWKETLLKLEIGQSVFVTGVSKETVEAAAFRVGSKQEPKVKFVVRAENEGFRVWRK